MALSGNTRELSLADLILVKAHDPGNYRLRLTGPAGDGLLYLRGGRVVHAAYGELPAVDAACLLVTEEAVDFEVECEVNLPGQTLDLSAQELLMEAMRRFDEGVLKRPKPISVTMGTELSKRREPPRPRSHEARKSPEAEALRRATGRVLFADADLTVAPIKGRPSHLFWGVPLATLAVLGLGVASWRFGLLSPVRHREPVRVSDLEGPRDVLPVLLSGAPATAPADAEPGFHPMILYRIRIDRQGNVHAQRPLDSRADLKDFEEAASEALRSYRFAPALREGISVPVELNWPVDFVWRNVPAPAPVPVEARFFTDPLLDRLPELIEGEPPETPLPEKRLRPRIMCRILVDEEGNVAEASVLDSRSDLEIYERTALEAVGRFRFTPGRRESQIVPTWMVWPIEFR